MYALVLGEEACGLKRRSMHQRVTGPLLPSAAPPAASCPRTAAPVPSPKRTFPLSPASPDSESSLCSSDSSPASPSAPRTRRRFGSLLSSSNVRSTNHPTLPAAHTNSGLSASYSAIRAFKVVFGQESGSVVGLTRETLLCRAL